jgi:hypothetical protein
MNKHELVASIPVSPPHGESRLKKVGAAALVPIGMFACLLLVAALLRGMVWASEKALPFLVSASGIAFDICIFGLLPLCIFRKTRPWAGVGLYIASFVFGVMVFAYSCFFAVYIWGFGGLAVGLIFAGVGVVPVALLAALLHREWAVLIEILVGVFLTFGTRIPGIYLSARHVEEKEPAF